MPQQINLSTPILLAQKRYFSAQTMLLSLSVFVLLGGLGAAYGLWNLRAATGVLQASLATQEPELARLRASAAAAKVMDAAGDASALQQVQAARAQLAERTRHLADLQQGLLAPGRGHSARLQLVAQTIPAQAWILGMVADDNHMEVTGMTQEPAVLNEWVARLGRSPVLA
ncbi:MAG: PilN domain-containing protein, partial [Rhodoferax sp.]|nr:PilN domain-containing protein [Rhodoferax sp.]